MISTILGSLIFSFYTPALAQEIPAFDRVGERVKMLKQIEQIPVTKVELSTDGATPEQKRFLDFFSDKIWPRIQKVEELDARASLWKVALDRGLFDSKQEQDAWTKAMEEAENQFNEIMADPEWSEEVKQWAGLSQGLTGTLAEFARGFEKQMELEGYPPEAAPLLKRLTEVTSKISEVANTSKFGGKNLSENTKAVNTVVSDYYAGKVSFADAWSILETLSAKGRNAIGQDVGTLGRQFLNEAAILRTKIAQLKGYKTWAELQLARQAINYSPGARTPDERIAFLRGLLAATEAPYREFVEKRLSEIAPGQRPSLNELRASQTGLLSFDTSLLRPYFPREKFEAVWKKTMLESGASPQLLESVSLDGFPRDGKQSHAYLMTASGHKPTVIRINAATLAISVPRGEQPHGWFPAQLFIVQNYQDDGPGYLEVAFHEGGHTLDRGQRLGHQFDLINGHSAWSETHSMTMEKFLEDAEFLLAVGETREGVKLTRKLAQTFITNSQLNALAEFRRQVGLALTDLLIWNHAYTEKGEEFVSRTIDIYRNINAEAAMARFASIDGVDPAMRVFATSHFWDGTVRYISYVYADVAARMTAEALWDRFEKETGRRSFYRQPRLVPILKQAYYERGFEKPFPLPIEELTGKSYSPEAVVGGLARAVKNYEPKSVSECEMPLHSRESYLRTLKERFAGLYSKFRF